MAESKSMQKQESQSIDKLERTRSSRLYVPATDIIEKDNAILLLSDMPGCDEKSINITLENNQLTIEGRVDFKTPDEYQLIHSEYGTGDYYRSFVLNDMVDREKIEAHYKNGVLRLTLPKSEKTKARQIAVTAG